MEYSDFKRLIDSLLVKNKETEWIEFKENFHSKEEIGERISALSNSAFLCNMPFGYIVFGVNNDSLKVVGPLRITVQEARTIVTLFAYRKYADLDRQERIYACYQHACLKYVTNDKMTNLTLRERLGIEKQNYPMASRIIKDTLNAGKIKEEKTENHSRNNKGYVPFWA